MKLRALWILLAFIPAMNADITCNGGATSIPVLDPSSSSAAAVGDYTLDCTGVPAVPPQSNAPQMNIDMTLDAPIFTPGSWTLADLTNSFDYTGIVMLSNQIEFSGVLLAPNAAGQLNFQVEGIDVNPSLEPPGFQFDEVVNISSSEAIAVAGVTQEVAVNGAVPEPSMLWLVGLGLGATLMGRKLRRLGV